MKQRRILLVDDERPVRDAIRLLLQLENCQVVEAESGEQAMALLEHEQFDIILTDFRMAQDGMTGGDLAAAVKNSNASVPIILVTGFHDTIAPGIFDAVLYKPFTLEQLRGTIRKLLEPNRNA